MSSSALSSRTLSAGALSAGAPPSGTACSGVDRSQADVPDWNAGLSRFAGAHRLDGTRYAPLLLQRRVPLAWAGGRPWRKTAPAAARAAFAGTHCWRLGQYPLGSSLSAVLRAPRIQPSIPAANREISRAGRAFDRDLTAKNSELACAAIPTGKYSTGLGRRMFGFSVWDVGDAEHFHRLARGFRFRRFIGSLRRGI